MAPRQPASPPKPSSRSATPAKKAAAKKAASKKAPARRPAKKAPARKKAPATKVAPAEEWVATPLHPDPELRWRPTDRESRKGPVCGFTLGTKTCTKKGAHYCEPRADKVVFFYALVLVHVMGPYARRAFVLELWQELDIIRPLFGEVIWSQHWGMYVRRYTQAFVVLGRKNGKSGIASGTGLYLTVADDEEAATVYCAAKDTKQAGKVFEPAIRMRELSSRLLKATTYNKNQKRISYPKNASYFEIIIDDADGELGHNPHGFILDEVLAIPDGGLWTTMTSAAGARTQPLFLAITTETNAPGSWGAAVIDEAERIQEDPSRAPRTFAYCRTSPRTDEQLDNLRRTFPGHPDLPVSLDWTDERNWRWPNPALGTFLNIENLRADAANALTDPTKENGFRQFRLNQRVSQVTRWMPLHVWDGQGNIQMIDEDELVGRSCFAGLDLSSTTDLSAWALLFPPRNDDEDYTVLWRFWTPEAMVPFLDKHTGGMASQWIRQGFLYASEGDWIDYEGDEDGMSGGSPSIHRMIREDKARFRILGVGYDQHEATGTAQYMQRLGLKVAPVTQGYGLSESLKEIMRRVKAERFGHGGNPVMRWNIDSAEVRSNDREGIKLVKPDRDASGKRVDGLAAVANAVATELAYEDVRHAPVVRTGTAGVEPTFFRPDRRLKL